MKNEGRKELKDQDDDERFHLHEISSADYFWHQKNNWKGLDLNSNAALLVTFKRYLIIDDS